MQRCCQGKMRTLHSSAASVLIKEELKSVEAVEGGTATLQCQLSREASVEWRKGHALLRPSHKYRMRQEGAVAELLIHDLEPQDAGDYTCVVGTQKTTAALAVNGKMSQATCAALRRFCPSLPSFFLYMPSCVCIRVLLPHPSSSHLSRCHATPCPSLQLLLCPVLCVPCCLLAFPQGCSRVCCVFLD